MTDQPQAQNLEDDRESFGLQVAGAAHHLNNIFAQVLLNAELLDRSRLDETAIGMLDSIVQGTHTAINVVDVLSQQSTSGVGERVVIDLKYLVKGLQKRREVLFADGVVINAQYPPQVRLAWGASAPLFRAVMSLCRQAVETAPENHALFVQVGDIETADGSEGAAIDIAAPLPLVDGGLRAGADVDTVPELAASVGAARASGAEVSIVESQTGATLVRFAFPSPPEQR